MATKSKLELVMELADKLFNNKLSQVQAKLSGATDKMEGKLQRFNMKQIKVFSNIGESFDPVKVNQMTDLFDNLSEKLDFTKDISKTKVALQQMGVENVDKMAGKIHELGAIMEAEDMEIAKAANAITKQIGGSFEENLKIMEQGYNKGADLNGDMLDQLKEYGPAMAENGIGIKEMLAIMAQSGANGVFSDKALDSLKEGGLAIREFGKGQEDALNGIGMKIGDITGKTSWEAMQLISKNMEGMTTQAKQLVLADIFKGAGEDGGMALIEGFSKGLIPFEDIPEIKATDTGLKVWVANIQSSIADNVGGWMPLIQALGMGGMAISGIISLGGSLFPMLSKIANFTKLSAAAQWLWNIALNANPIGLIVVGIFALIGVIILAIAKWDEWGAALMVFMGPIGLVIGAFKSVYDHWESIKTAFQTEGIVGGLKRIGIVLLDAILKPLQQILELVAKVDPTGLAQKGVDSIKAFRESQNLVTPGEKEARAVNGVSATENAPKSSLLKAPVIDGKLAPTGKTKKEGEQVSKVTGQANQVRKIDIRIDSFNKGGINVAQGAYAGMTKDDVEAWFKEMMRRVVINAETV